MSTSGDHNHSLQSSNNGERIERPPAVPYPDRSGRSADIILPDYIYIRDKLGRYLTVDVVLNFQSITPDMRCVFQTYTHKESKYCLGCYGSKKVGRTINNKTGVRYYEFNKGEEDLVFLFISSRGNIVYLKDTSNPSLFMCNILVDVGSPLARDFINEDSEMEISIAAVKNEIIDVVYDINGGKVREAAPLIVLSTSVRNDSEGDVNQTLSYSYEKWSAGTWNNAAGIELGAKTTFKAGIPFVASAEFEISVSASYSHEWGGEEGVREIINSSTNVTVPPKKKARATIVVRNAQIDVGFTYTQRILWSDGKSEDKSWKGIYNNVDSWHVDVNLDNWEDI